MGYKTEEAKRNQQAFKKLDKVGKIKAYLQEKETYVLTDAEMEYLKLLKGCFQILSNTSSMNDAVEEVQKLFSVDTESIMRRSKASKLINETQLIFGDMIERNVQFERMLMSERYMLLYQKAIDIQKYDVARSCLKNACSIMGLDKEDSMIDYSLFKIPDLAFTNDIEVLKTT